MQEALDVAAPVPADDRRRDLVADRVAEHGRVAGAHAHRLAHATLDVSDEAPVVEERDVLLPRKPDEHVLPLLLRDVEQPARWDGVRADGVDAVRRHGFEVVTHLIGVVLLDSGVVGCERAVRNALHVELFAPCGEELPVHCWPRCRRQKVVFRVR